MGVGRSRALLLAWVALSAQPAAAQSPLTQTLTNQVTVDWAAGVMIAKGVGLADRRAPTPDVARAAARSRGVAQARERLSAALLLVPWANGKGTAAQLTATQLETLTGTAAIVAAQPQTDGGWQITLQLPLEAVRQAARGNRTLAVDGDVAAAPDVVLDARKLRVAPAVGLRVDEGGAIVECATRWVTQWPGASTKISSVNAGVIKLSKTAGIKPATLCVIIVSQ